MENFGIMMPQSFLAFYGKNSVYVHFEFSKKWSEFKEHLEKGDLQQCQLNGKDIDVWVIQGLAYDLGGYCPASLQEHFNDYCKPKEIGFKTYTPFETK